MIGHREPQMPVKARKGPRSEKHGPLYLSAVYRNQPAAAAGCGRIFRSLTVAQALAICLSRKVTASPTDWIFWASSSEMLPPKVFLERHDQLNQVQRIGLQILTEAGPYRDQARVDVQLLDDDRLDFSRRYPFMSLL